MQHMGLLIIQHDRIPPWISILSCPALVVQQSFITFLRVFSRTAEKPREKISFFISVLSLIREMEHRFHPLRSQQAPDVIWWVFQGTTQRLINCVHFLLLWGQLDVEMLQRWDEKKEDGHRLKAWEPTQSVPGANLNQARTTWVGRYL